MSYSSFGIEKGQLIRVPATANLMIDSDDRPKRYDSSGVDLTTPWDFQISRQQALMNGFFSRIGVTEHVVEWCVPNISLSLGNNTFRIRDASGVIHSVTLTDTTYNVAEATVSICVELNALTIPGYSFNMQGAAGTVIMRSNTAAPFRSFSILPGKLAFQLDLNPFTVETNQSVLFFVKCPDIRPYRYIDFTCSDLTAVQDVKDASTAPASQVQPNGTVKPTIGSRDVLARWYFAFDEDASLDQLGFPILMGYEKFVLRRLYNPPKQIKWEQNFPVGNLTFQVFDPDGEIVSYEDANPNVVNTAQDSNWLMTLQLSEG